MKFRNHNKLLQLICNIIMCMLVSHVPPFSVLIYIYERDRNMFNISHIY
jgi:NADPH-dependent 7-cyano-7-deazaguanine reductase QueF